MSILYPTSLDSLSNPTSTDLLDNASASLDHWTQHADANDAIEALEAKVGVNNSAVTTSFDYKLSGVTGSDKAVSKTGAETLTNKTLTSPTVTGMTATTSTVNGVTLSNGGGTSVFLRGDGTYATPTAGDASYLAKGSVQGLTDAATSGLTISAGVISVNSGTSANNIVKLDASAKLPAVDGSQLTNLANPAVYKSGNTTRDLTTATGTQTIAHGLAKTPKYIRISYKKSYSDQALGSSTPGFFDGIGTYNGSAYANTYNGSDSSSTSAAYLTTFQSTSNIIVYTAGSGGSTVEQAATVSALDSTNITLSWTKTGSPSGTLLMTWEAFA